MNITEMRKEHKLAIIIFALSLLMTIGLGIVVLQGILKDTWYMDLAICALGATALTSLFEVLGGKG